MSAGPQANRFAPPAAHVEDVDSATTGELAGRGIRLIAVIVDRLLSGGVFLLIARLTPFNAFDPRGAVGVGRPSARTCCVGFFAFLVLHGWLLHTPRPDHRQGAAQDQGRAQRRPPGVAAAPGRAALLRQPRCWRWCRWSAGSTPWSTPS